MAKIGRILKRSRRTAEKSIKSDQPPLVTEALIAKSLRKLGLSDGRSVFVHSALSSFGKVEGGASAVCRAIRSVVGHEGTICMPAFTFSLREKPDAILDQKNEPSCVGRISEVFRKRFATHRSSHITHSVSAWGKKSAPFTEGPAPDAFDETSAFGQLVADNGCVLLLGVDYNQCTFLHAVELALPVPYMGMTPKADAKVRRCDGTIVPARSRIHCPTKPYDFNRIAPLLDSEHLVKTVSCGNAIIRMFPAAPVYRRVLKELKQRKFALTQVGEKKMDVPVCISAAGKFRR
jgi:aminoglycoside 3-N-acetyltransferase